MYKDPILTIIAELRLMIDAKDLEINRLIVKVSELQSKIVLLSENLMRDTV